MASRKVIIALAPVAAGTSIDYKALAADIVASVDEGASMCHLHARNEKGELTADCTPMMDCFEAVRAERDVIVQASTGGVSDLSIEDRCNPLRYGIVESCSLNGGSTNLGEAVYHNSFEEIRYVAKRSYAANTVPEIEVFDIGMIQAVEEISKQTPFRTPKLYNLVFGHKGGMQPSPEALMAFRSFVPDDCMWGVTHYGRTDWDFLAMAIAAGATDVRIGFEDSASLGNGKTASCNAQLVTRLRKLIEAIGYETATPAEAREILGIK